MEKIKQQAIDLLNKCEVLTLASIDERGCPRPVVLSKIKTEGIDTIWFLNGNKLGEDKRFYQKPESRSRFLRRTRQCYADRHNRSGKRCGRKESPLGGLVL